MRVFLVILAAALGPELARSLRHPAAKSHVLPLGGVPPPLNRLSFVYNSPRISLGRNFARNLPVPGPKLNTPGPWARPSGLFAQGPGVVAADNRKGARPGWPAAAPRAPPLRHRFSPLESLLSLSGYLLPFINSSYAFFGLLRSMSLPYAANYVIGCAIRLYSLLYSVPNLADLVSLVLHRVFIKRNALNLSHFVKFNFTQYSNFLTHLYLSFVRPLGDGLVPTSIGYTMAFSAFAPLLYCMGCAAAGAYARIPILSDAAHVQTQSQGV